MGPIGPRQNYASKPLIGLLFDAHASFILNEWAIFQSTDQTDAVFLRFSLSPTFQSKTVQFFTLTKWNELRARWLYFYTKGYRFMETFITIDLIQPHNVCCKTSSTKFGNVTLFMWNEKASLRVTMVVLRLDIHFRNSYKLHIYLGKL